MKPVLFDFYCKAGGASYGYHLAGFEVVGVDIEPQPNYPFEFIQMDAIEAIYKYADEFDAAAASPPCKSATGLQNLGIARNGSYPDHEDLIPATREALKTTGKPYIIENVVGSSLTDYITLCGKSFGLKVYRHRRFESNALLLAPPHLPHRDKTPSAGNGKSPKGFISVCGTGGVKGMTSDEIVNYWSYAMGIDWMTRAELAQAIPPAYTEYLGKQLMKHVKAKSTVLEGVA